MKSFWLHFGVWLLVCPASAMTQSPFQITEFVAENQTGIMDEAGDVSDWIEIHNRTSESQSLQGWSLTDSDTEPRKWSFPDVTLTAGKYLVVFASGHNRSLSAKPLHTSFKLDAKGEYLALTNPDGEVVDSFRSRFPKQRADVSYGHPDSDGQPGPPSYLAYPTPGSKNAYVRIGQLSTIEFSKPHGLYQEPFELSVTTNDPEVTVRYTVDGSQPTEVSEILRGPRSIDRTTVMRARGFRKGYTPTPVMTRSYIFPKDCVDDSADGLPPADYAYRWGTGRSHYGMDSLITQDPVYRQRVLQALQAIPSCSLVIAAEDLFSDERGIYAHAGWHGRRAERKCSLEFLPGKSAGGAAGVQIDCGVRMRGGFSRNPRFPKHGFRFFFRGQYGRGRLKYDLFDQAAVREFDHIDLRCSQNYSWHHGFNPRALYMRDQFNRDTQLAMGHPVPRGDFRHLYVNGHYWGLFNTCERPDASFGASYIGGKKRNFDVVKIMGGYSEGDADRRYQVFATDGSMDRWEQLDKLTQRDLSRLENYCEVIGVQADGSPDPDGRRLLDPVNLADYMLTIFYGGNLDAPVSLFGGNGVGNNWYGVLNRKRNVGFRFIIWDAEHTLLDLSHDRLGPFPAGRSADRSNPQWIYQRCLESGEFRMLLADRICKHMHRDGVLTPAASRVRFDRRIAEIESALFAEAARWGNPRKLYEALLGEPPNRPVDPRANGVAKYQAWVQEVERIRTEYLPKRTDTVLQQLFSRGLYPDFPEIQATWSSADDNQSTLTLASGDVPIYYTMSQQDPRRFGGALNTQARRYTGPVQADGKSSVLCRIYDGREWGPLREIPPKN